MPAHLHDEIESGIYHHNHNHHRPPVPSPAASYDSYSQSSPYHNGVDSPASVSATSLTPHAPPAPVHPALPPIRTLQPMTGPDAPSPFSHNYSPYGLADGLHRPAAASTPPHPAHGPALASPTILSPGAYAYHQQPPPGFSPPDRDYLSGIIGGGPSPSVSASSPGADSGDSRSRKRRGNLPKHVTDVLRAWFHAHLDHPYPSEEDKQMLIGQTGLTINQVCPSLDCVCAHTC